MARHVARSEIASIGDIIVGSRPMHLSVRRYKLSNVRYWEWASHRAQRRVVPKCDCNLSVTQSHYCHTQGSGQSNTGNDVMWVPTRDEAVLMYARFLKARHGGAASELARKKAGALQDVGDREGYTIWNSVADAVDRPSAWPRPRLLDTGRTA